MHKKQLVLLNKPNLFIDNLDLRFFYKMVFIATRYGIAALLLKRLFLTNSGPLHG